MTARTITTRETCRHILTTDQLLETGRQLAETQNEIGQLEGDFKSVRDDWKARISAAEARQVTLSGRISRGYDMKDTECTVYMDSPEVGLKTCLRNDTGERVWVRDMSESDKQLVLNFEKEEQQNAEAGGEDVSTETPAENVVQVLAEGAKELAEKSGIKPQTLLDALAAISQGANSVAKLQRVMQLGYTAAAKLYAVCQEAGAPAPGQEPPNAAEEPEPAGEGATKTKEGKDGEY